MQCKAGFHSNYHDRVPRSIVHDRAGIVHMRAIHCDVEVLALSLKSR